MNAHVNVSGWKTITLANGTLYVNETFRLCELHYSKSSVALTNGAWKDVETISQIADYPHTQTNDHLYVSGNMPYYTVRIYRNGQIKVYSTLSSSVAVTFSVIWHY